MGARLSCVKPRQEAEEASSADDPVTPQPTEAAAEPEAVPEASTSSPVGVPVAAEPLSDLQKLSLPDLGLRLPALAVNSSGSSSSSSLFSSSEGYARTQPRFLQPLP